MPETGSVIERMQSHIGGLVRLTFSRLRSQSSALHGKIGLLVRVDGQSGATLTAAVGVLIDGRVLTLYVYPHELELIGADNA